MTLIRNLVLAAAVALTPVAAFAQAAPAPATVLPTPATPEAGPSAPAPGGPEGTVQQAVAAPAPAFAHQAPTEDIGQPTAEGFRIQPQVTDVGQDALWFHDVVLMPIITLISLFVLALLLWVVFRYRRAANPIPSKTSHNTVIEVIWTLAPVLLLLIIAVPSIKLLARQYSPPKADLTVKVIGNQWYWTYQYPDNGDFELVSNMLPDDQAKARGEPRLLAVDERMVVPAGATVKLIVTSADVLHSFAMPAFWTKMDAVPGRLNETWFKVDRPGVYYGQCSELCGARHAYMPIAVEVVPPARFAAWVASKRGTMPGAAGADSPDATAQSPAVRGATDATDRAGGTPLPATAGQEGGESSDPVVNATTTPIVTSQGAAGNQGNQGQ